MRFLKEFSIERLTSDGDDHAARIVSDLVTCRSLAAVWKSWRSFPTLRLSRHTSSDLLWTAHPIDRLPIEIMFFLRTRDRSLGSPHWTIRNW